jgi:hypothetical protein
MNNRFHIASSQIIFSFRRNLEIRKRVFEFEDSLKGEFKIPFRVIAIPDEIDPNIPRFESQSLHGHSHLQVSQTRITLATSYNEEFRSNYLEVEDYITRKCKLISSLAEAENMDFIAYVIELNMHMDESEINSFVRQNTGAIAITESCRDFSLLYSKEHKDNFYFNITNSKFTEQELLLHNETKTLRPTGKAKNGISVVLDVNTRPYFEKNKQFDKSLYISTKKEVFNLINTKNIEDFLKGNL